MSIRASEAARSARLWSAEVYNSIRATGFGWHTTRAKSTKKIKKSAAAALDNVSKICDNNFAAAMAVQTVKGKSHEKAFTG